MKETKAALLGTGSIAEIHVGPYQRFVPNAEVVAVFTREPVRARGFAKKRGIRLVCGAPYAAITHSGGGPT